ncbi:hypothetical protein PRJ39_25765 [Lysobacter enzymogenes]|uniref:hypothetical protein n=1 Tax=Lysobacter enzymogenes TaxID=69 RepID=UPI00374882F8
MRRIRHRTRFLAALALAAGFDGSALAQKTCAMCRDNFDDCLAGRVVDRRECVGRYNACAGSMGWPMRPAE